MTRALWWAVTLVLTLVAGCGGGTDRTKAHVRLVNASATYSALNLTIGEDTVSSSVPYGSTSSYGDADPTRTNSSISRPGSATVLASPQVTVLKNRYYTMLAYDGASSLQTVMLDDNVGAPDSGKALVRILNAASDAGSLDVYLTAAGESLADSAAVQPGADFGTLGSFIVINSGTWRLRVTAKGSKTDLRLDISGLDFGSQSVKTLVLTPGRGGVLVNALLLAQQGEIGNAANTQARVRAAAGMSASVSVSVGGAALMTAVGAPVLAAYTLVDAGPAAVAASANGNPAALTSATLAGGGDYTLLVYGTAAVPVATLIEDDNRLPNDTRGSNLRLVHGMADVTGTLALAVDLQITADGVAQGSASAYGGVAVSSTARIRVTSAGNPKAVFNDDDTGTDRNFVANGVYTFFMLGDAATPVGVLRQDR